VSAAHSSGPPPTRQSTFFGGRSLVSGQRHGFVAGDRYHFGNHPAFFSEFWPSTEYYDGYSNYANYGMDFPAADDDTGSDPTVVAVQKALARGGYYHGPIDGTLSLITQDAIARYDRDYRMPVSHAVNQQLLNSLRLGSLRRQTSSSSHNKTNGH
jgi:hypothetical protein